MKRQKNNRIFLLLLLLVAPALAMSQDSEEKTPNLELRYFLSEKNVPYILVQSRYKIGRRFEPAKGIKLNIYLDEANSSFLMAADIVTDETGKVIAALPSSLKDAWESSDSHKFIAEASGNKDFDGMEEEIEIQKAKLILDTSSDDGIKKITATVLQLVKGEWVPAKDVELKIGVQRMESALNVGEDDTYTTDDEGQASAEFTIDSLPGDSQGNLILVASVEDNDMFGNLKAKKTVQWGIPKYLAKSDFGIRSLYATRGKSPAWLLFMAYGIIGIVWGTLIYLVFQIFKIRKLGNQASS